MCQFIPCAFFVLGLALRVSPAVTRLTVYCWLYISMMARTFNDVYCTSPAEPCLGRKTTPILEWIFFQCISEEHYRLFAHGFLCLVLFSILLVFGFALLVSLPGLFVTFSICLYVRVLLHRL